LQLYQQKFNKTCEKFRKVVVLIWWILYIQVDLLNGARRNGFGR